jgi:OOP family OmpA-OmpF porin
MKRLLLLPALLLGSASFADTAKYEISPMIGYNFAEGNIGMKNDGYLMGGLEIQANSPDSKLSPELSLYYTHDADYDSVAKDTDILRLSFNGVYTFDAVGSLVPFAKAGVGYENVNNETAENQDGFFADAGAGVKIPLSDSFSFKAEAIYLAKITNAQNSTVDNNLMTLVGFTYSFGAMKQKAAPKEAVVEEEVVEEVVVPVVVVPVEKDSDGDGIYDKLDKCPNTPEGSTVGVDGCPVVLDADHDSVLNENDLCPNTPVGEKVDKNGCPMIANLHITFANNSAEVPADADALLSKYAKFLKTNKNYSAKIVGYTDNRGSKEYNQKLSQKRAEAVMNALIAKGVDPKQLSAVGMGVLNPVATNDTAEGRATNRRIEAELSYK